MVVSVSAGNSDNKLTQQEWWAFVAELSDIIKEHEVVRYFFGGSENYAPWQNVCWLVEVLDLEPLLPDLAECRARYKQDSVFVLAGKGEFI